jgi:hypothetical protein
VDRPIRSGAATLGFLVNDYERWNGRQWQPVRYRELIKGERVRFAPAADVRAPRRPLNARATAAASSASSGCSRLTAWFSKTPTGTPSR